MPAGGADELLPSARSNRRDVLAHTETLNLGSTTPPPTSSAQSQPQTKSAGINVREGGDDDTGELKTFYCHAQKNQTRLFNLPRNDNKKEVCHLCLESRLEPVDLARGVDI